MAQLIPHLYGLSFSHRVSNSLRYRLIFFSNVNLKQAGMGLPASSNDFWGSLEQTIR